MDKLTIRLSRQYDVLMDDDLLDFCGSIIKEVTGPCRICMVTDSTVNELFSERVEHSLLAAGFEVHKAVFAPGEGTKSIESLGQLLEFLAEREFTRSDVLAALGGGVIGDLTGFAAATYLRGIRFIQIPTTLLAAVDASVGGKTAINLKAGKNLAGAFWQPSLVLFDPETLSQLPNHIFLDGLAEVIKSGAIMDQELFTYVSRAEEPDFTRFVKHCVMASIKVKRTLVEGDERDTGQRQLLNFGHTAGHAIEKCSEYRISHGHAVAIGMLIAARASWKMAWSRYDCSMPIRNVLLKYNYPIDCGFSAGQLTEAALRDKKRKGDTMNLVIPLKIGECALMEIPVSALGEFISAGMEA
ncbi:MAG: 3-dehydroquinate synthase [Anaerovoracaceae bacterium]|jgi:3-dehydroquinate synthase